MKIPVSAWDENPGFCMGTICIMGDIELMGTFHTELMGIFHGVM